MNKFTLLSLACLFLFSFSNISAQVAAGVTDNLILGQKNVQLPVFAPNSGDYDIRHDSLDFNGDGQYDALFTAEAAWVPDYVGGRTSIEALHPGFALMIDSGDFVRPLAAGDSINAAQTWSLSSLPWDLYYSAFVSRFWGNTGQLQQYGNWMPPNSTAYVGFRIFTVQDTLYGWFRVTASANPNFPGAGLTVNSLWAIEAPATSNQPVDFVVAGGTSDLVPGDQTLILLQDSVPFPGSADQSDTLDLNQDGIDDVSFHVTIGNMPDYSASSTLILAIHDGFTFVNGPLFDAKRFENGDTIFSNADWSLNWGSNLASQGTGINGFQSAGEWVDDNDGYLGFRLVTPASDTLLGCIHIYTYSHAASGAYLEVLGWAIQHDPSQKPYAAVAMTPQKPVYCPGDYVTFEATAVGEDQITWHFWDGLTDTSSSVTRILPDSSVTVTLEATNQNGTTTVTQILEVSPLDITTKDDTITCAQPFAVLIAETNIPAVIWWSFLSDTIQNPTLTVDAPGIYWVTAEDEYGCVASTYAEVFIDMAIPGDLNIEYDEANHLLIAHSSTPNVTFIWIAPDWISSGDTVVVPHSGTYLVMATAPNGCTSLASISVVITSAGEPLAESITILPNPASDFLQIENRLANDLNFRIFDTSGSLQSEAGAVAAGSTIHLDIVSLPAGLYLLAGCDSGGKPLFFKKFVKL